MLRKISILLVCLMFISILPANAMEMRATNTLPSLSFSGSTANCYVKVDAWGNSISLTLELVHNGAVIDSWTKSGVSTVKIDETCHVTRGQTYTLRVSGTAGGEAISGSITRTCP